MIVMRNDLCHCQGSGDPLHWLVVFARTHRALGKLALWQNMGRDSESHWCVKLLAGDFGWPEQISRRS